MEIHMLKLDLCKVLFARVVHEFRKLRETFNL